jgi:hypothetical protein
MIAPKASPGAPVPTDDDYRLLVVQIQAAQRIAARLRLPMLHHILSMAELEAIKSFRDSGAAGANLPRQA